MRGLKGGSLTQPAAEAAVPAGLAAAVAGLGLAAVCERARVGRSRRVAMSFMVAPMIIGSEFQLLAFSL
jgi:hypothetical protein